MDSKVFCIDSPRKRCFAAPASFMMLEFFIICSTSQLYRDAIGRMGPPIIGCGLIRGPGGWNLVAHCGPRKRLSNELTLTLLAIGRLVFRKSSSSNVTDVRDADVATVVCISASSYV